MEKYPVVLLHGVGLDHKMWAPLVQHLEVHGLQCVALDLPGHGQQPPLREPQNLATLADDVIARMPKGRVHLVGFSLGALIAQNIASRKNSDVATLTSVNSVCRRTTEEAAKVQSRFSAAKSDFLASIEASIERWFPQGTNQVSAEDIAQVRSTLAQNDIESYLHAYSVFANGDEEIAPDLKKIEAPSLAITGEYDPGSTPEMSVRLAEVVPNTKVVVVPNTRHMMPLETSETLARHIIDFVTSGDEVHSRENLPEGNR